MTALVVLDNCGPDEEVAIPREATLAEGSSIYLRAGEKYKVSDLIYGLILASGNDAALALAIHAGGSVEGFAQMMNEKAVELGLSNTSFENPHGLDADDHYSTAADLALIMKAAMENDFFSQVTGSKSHHVNGQTYVNHNKLLWRYEGITGGKTGYTMAAGRSHISSAARDGLRLICVTLSDPNDWEDHANLYNWAFGMYDYVTVLEPGELTRIPVVSGVMDSVGIAPRNDLSLLVEKGREPLLRIELPRFVFAGVLSGKVAGKVIVQMPEGEEREIALYFTETVMQDVSLRLSNWERFFWILRNAPMARMGFNGEFLRKY